MLPDSSALQVFRGCMLSDCFVIIPTVLGAHFYFVVLCIWGLSDKVVSVLDFRFIHVASMSMPISNCCRVWLVMFICVHGMSSYVLFFFCSDVEIVCFVVWCPFELHLDKRQHEDRKSVVLSLIPS